LIIGLRLGRELEPDLITGLVVFLLICLGDLGDLVGFGVDFFLIAGLVDGDGFGDSVRL
jgi:hypothetical protein